MTLAPSLPLELTEVAATRPGMRRAAHGLAHQSPLRFLRRVVEVGLEVALADARDALSRRRARPDPIRRMEPGLDPFPSARGVALYVHYSRSGQVSDMVRTQLAAYTAAGFAVVFVSVAPDLPEAAFQAARACCALVVHRRNGGMDFGAWQDLAPEASRRWPEATEWLLTNDSILGPLRPLAPLFAALRAGGEGVFGMTESAQGGHHLQSYFVLARGAAAIGALRDFLAALRLSSSKWRVVQRGELGLTRYLLGRGIRVQALFGYARLVRAALADNAETTYLVAACPALAPLSALPPGQREPALEAALLRWPLNPTHPLWRCLVQRLGFPFIKTQLVRHNPGHLPGVAEWPLLVGPEAPCSATMLQAHLAAG